MTKFTVPPGHVLLRVEDLAALLGRPAPPPPGSVYWPALSACVALVANRLDCTGASNADLTRDVPPEAITDVLVLILATALNAATTDRGAGLLRDLGLLAAKKAER